MASQFIKDYIGTRSKIEKAIESSANMTPQKPKHHKVDNLQHHRKHNTCKTGTFQNHEIAKSRR